MIREWFYMDMLVDAGMLRNRELMRVFKDVELVEMLGSGMQRILDAYDRSVFEITPSFISIKGCRGGNGG
jgi:predicted HTH transcriptional regulator